MTHIYDNVKSSSVISDIEKKSFYQQDHTRKAINKNVSTNGTYTTEGSQRSSSDLAVFTLNKFSHPTQSTP